MHTISIVVAAIENDAPLLDCLTALAHQRTADMEVIVCGNFPAPNDLLNRFPWVQWQSARENTLIPHLWGRGMRCAHGDIVAITTAHFLPAHDWVESIRHAHGSVEAPVIGGRIGHPLGNSMLAWAIYFLRYSGYRRCTTPQVVADVPGDNATYRRSLLDTHAKFFQDGFWELELHKSLVAEGVKIMLDPRICVRQHGNFGFFHFLRQRFLHGKQFGSDRVACRGIPFRLAALAGSPIVPLIFLGKIIKRLIGRPRRGLRLLSCLPVLVCFLLAWALGEATGYCQSLWPARRTRPATGVRLEAARAAGAPVLR